MGNSMISICCPSPGGASTVAKSREYSTEADAPRNATFSDDPLEGVDNVKIMSSVGLLRDYGFSPFGHETEAQSRFYLDMLKVLGLQDRFNLRSDTILGCANKIMNTYRDNPYHNRFHGFSVTQILFAAFMTSDFIRAGFADPCSVDVISLFVAALAHDADHPGNNNQWEVASKTALAVKYAETSVLENHHAAVGLQIMADSDIKFLDSLDSDLRPRFREAYTHAILMTDMALHFKMVESLKPFHEGCKNDGHGKRFADSLEDRLHLVGVLAHSVDISNPLVPKFDLARRWAELITQEFVGQYAMEVKAGLPETKMWANLRDPAAFYKSQVGFIDFIVAPLWTMVLDLFPDLEAEAGLGSNLEANKTRWKELVAEEESKTKKVQEPAA